MLVFARWIHTVFGSTSSRRRRVVLAFVALNTACAPTLAPAAPASVRHPSTAAALPELWTASRQRALAAAQRDGQGIISNQDRERLVTHIEAWAQRWTEARTHIGGPPEAACLDLELQQRAFVLDHLEAECDDRYCRTERVENLALRYQHSDRSIDQCASPFTEQAFGGELGSPDSVAVRARILGYAELGAKGLLNQTLEAQLDAHPKPTSSLHRWLERQQVRYLLRFPVTTYRAVLRSGELTELAANQGSDAELLDATALHRDALAAAGRRVEAQVEAVRTVRLAERIHGSQALATSDAYLRLGDATTELMEHRAALQAFTLALRVARRAKASHLELARVLSRLAVAQARLGRRRESSRLFQLAKRHIDQELPTNSLSHAQLLLTEGHTKRILGETRVAREKLSAALTIQERVLGEAHPEVARALLERGLCDVDDWNWEGAKHWLQLAASAAESGIGPFSSVAISIGIAQSDVQRSLDPAATWQVRDHLSDLLALLTRTYGEAHPLMVPILMRQAALDAPLWPFRAERAVRISEEINGENYRGNRDLYRELGDQLAQVGGYSDASRWHSRYLEQLLVDPDTPAPILADAYTRLAWDKLRGARPGAIELALKARALQLRSLPSNDETHAATCDLLGRASADLRLYAAALTWFRCARDRSEAARDERGVERERRLIGMLCGVGHAPACSEGQRFRTATSIPR